MQTVGFHDHDHDDCIKAGIERAALTCEQSKLQFTPVRRRVLEILLSRHKALGAYEVLDILRDEGFGSQPPVAYRALDFLVKNGFAHRIEHLNAFIACTEDSNCAGPAFLICRICDSVAEAHVNPIQGPLSAAAKDAGFELERAVIEALGICPACKESSAS